MDSRDRSIATQVAFKAAIDAERDIDLTDPAGQARFHEVFEYLQTELVTAIVMLSDESEQVAQIIQGEFPGRHRWSVDHRCTSTSSRSTRHQAPSRGSGSP